MCGEGGEYESLTLDCPLFRRGRIVLDSWQVRPLLEERPLPLPCVLCLTCSLLQTPHTYTEGTAKP